MMKQMVEKQLGAYHGFFPWLKTEERKNHGVPKDALLMVKPNCRKESNQWSMVWGGGEYSPPLQVSELQKSMGIFPPFQVSDVSSKSQWGGIFPLGFCPLA
jgi:hypothetical protein